MERNLKAFRNGEPKMVNFEGHDPRLISNPALCEIYGVLHREYERLLPTWSEGAGYIEDTLAEIVSILQERVHDCINAEFSSPEVTANDD